MASLRVHIVEPHSNGRISGGYLYNQKLALEGSGIQRHPVGLETFPRDLGGLELGEPALVLADSLFLRPELMAPFLALRRPGVRVGVVMHALPSFIERAGDRELLAESLPLRPTKLELALLEQLDVVVAPGPYVPRLLAACGAKVRTLVCPPGTDVPSAAPPSPRPVHAEVRIVSLGSVTPLKGFADGVRALAGVPARDFCWTIIGHLDGAPAHVAQLRQLVNALGLAARVRLVGQLDHEATLNELRQSELLLLPSYTENYPLVAVEALSAGVPVIGYEVGGVPDIVQHEHTGLLAPVLDVGALTRHLARAISDSQTRQRMSVACLRAKQAFSTWEASARGLLRDLEQEVSFS